jgi:glycosyltransferase involved in cell wall biosynthesis
MKPIRVIYDEQIFTVQRHGGISTYFLQLIRQFKAHPELGVEPISLCGSYRNPEVGLEVGCKNSHRSLAASFVRILMALLRRNSKEPKGDLVHLTFYFPGFLARFPSLPKVATLFDMIPEKVKPNFRLWNPHFCKRQYLENVSGILSISKISSKEMKQIYGNSLPTSLTYLGVGPEFKPGLPRSIWAPEKYVLFVGNRDGYKNWHNATTAFSKVRETYPELVLQAVGGGRLNWRENRQLKRLGIREFVRQSNVGEFELPNIYSNALLLVYPSIHEGFGLPLVEAMGSGIPIAAANTLINKEICEEVAHFFDPLDVNSISNTLLGILSETFPLTDKLDAGKERALDFSWYACAKKTAEAYKAALTSEGVNHREK